MRGFGFTEELSHFVLRQKMVQLRCDFKDISEDSPPCLVEELNCPDFFGCSSLKGVGMLFEQSHHCRSSSSETF
jgi:hypothetical protein